VTKVPTPENYKFFHDLECKAYPKDIFVVLNEFDYPIIITS